MAETIPDGKTEAVGGEVIPEVFKSVSDTYKKLVVGTVRWLREDCPLCGAPVLLDEKEEVVYCIRATCGYVYNVTEEHELMGVEEGENSVYG